MENHGNSEIFRNKYLKYKTKYNELKLEMSKQFGGMVPSTPVTKPASATPTTVPAPAKACNASCNCIGYRPSMANVRMCSRCNHDWSKHNPDYPHYMN